MDWGDVPAWVAVVVSLVATVRAWSADRRAREATAGAASIEVSLERIADLMERQLPREEPLRAQSLPAPAGSRPARAPDFTVELLQGGAYRLRNVGDLAATGLTVSVEHPDRLVADLPDGIRLPPLAATEPFRVDRSWGSPVPAALLVRCDQLPVGAVVPLPSRDGRSG